MTILALLIMLYSGINLGIIWGAVGLRKARERPRWGYDIDIMVVMFVSSALYLFLDGV